MKRFFRRGFIPLLFLFLMIQAPWSQAFEGFRVVATTKPVHSLLAGLMRGVEGLYLLKHSGPGGQPLTEQDKKQVANADLVVWMGPGLEPDLGSVLQTKRSESLVLNLLNMPALKILPARWNENLPDPFFWIDTRNAILLLDELTRILMDADPGRSHLYLRNRKAFLPDIQQIDREFEYGYRGLRGGIGVLYHDVLQYFEQAYALHIGEILTVPGWKVDTGSLLKARARIRDGEFDCVLTDISLPAPLLPLMIRGLSVDTGELDVFGSRMEAGPDLYVQMMRYNTQVIRDCAKAGLSPNIATDDVPMASEPLGGKFILTDHRGRLVRDADFLGHYSLIYFGYTGCPDICPNSLQVMSLALKMLGEKADRIQPYFITLDPDRDKVGVMKDYVGYFDLSLIGLTGSRAMIDRVASQYRIRYEKVVEPGSDPDTYLMDHSAGLVFLGPDGRFISRFAYGITPKQLAEKLNDALP